MILDEEIDLLVNTADLAVSRANSGEASEGYTELLHGCKRAEDLREAGEEWGAALVNRWRETLDRFGERFGMGRA